MQHAPLPRYGPTNRGLTNLSPHTRGAHIDPHGFDAGKLIKGKKRHVLVDTLGLLLHALVTAADVQDRDGGLLVLATLFGQFPFLKKLFADSAYAGPKWSNVSTACAAYITGWPAPM